MDIKNGILNNDRALDPLATQKFGNRHFKSGFAACIMKRGAGGGGNGAVQDVGGTTTKLAMDGMLAARIERLITELDRIAGGLVKALPASWNNG